MAAIKGDRTLAEQFELHPNQIAQWKELPPIDLKALHTKIGELTLEIDFFGRSAHQSRPAERKTMIDQTHALPITRQAEALRIARFHGVRSAEADLGA